MPQREIKRVTSQGKDKAGRWESTTAGRCLPWNSRRLSDFGIEDGVEAGHGMKERISWEVGESGV